MPWSALRRPNVTWHCDAQNHDGAYFTFACTHTVGTGRFEKFGTKFEEFGALAGSAEGTGSRPCWILARRGRNVGHVACKSVEKYHVGRCLLSSDDKFKKKLKVRRLLLFSSLKYKPYTLLLASSPEPVDPPRVYDERPA